MAELKVYTFASLILFCLVLSLDAKSDKIRHRRNFEPEREADTRAEQIVAAVYDDINKSANSKIAALKAMKYRIKRGSIVDTYLMKVRAVHLDKHWSYLHIMVRQTSVGKSRMPPDAELIVTLFDKGEDDKLELEDFDFDLDRF